MTQLLGISVEVENRRAMSQDGIVKRPHLLCLGLASALWPNPGLDAQQLHTVRIDAHGNPYPETATSFDCHKALNHVETLICRDWILASLDGDLGDSYWRLQRRMSSAERSRLRRTQRAWLRSRDACLDHQCIAVAYDERSGALRRELDTRERRLRASVSRVGQCQVTGIEEIGPRLQRVEGEPPSGTSVGFANGVRQVSYDPVPWIWASRIGDRARVCLISIPRHCPPGDDHGRIYETINLRTGGRWRLPDASHRCGGA